MDMAKPIIRFKGYQDDWEQRKLSDCAGFRRGSFPQPYGNKDWYDGEGAMPFVQVADVSDNMKLVDDTKQKISKLAQPMSVCAEEGSVLVTLQGSIGRVAITQYKAFVDRTVLIFDKYNTDIDKTFWAYIIKEKFIEEARKAPGGTIKTITKEVLSDFDLMLPSYDEQKMLGKLLHFLDHLITLHQRKCDETKRLKKYMLQKMFPQNGEKVPEIRFSGFTDDWEQRKLEDIAEFSKGSGYSKGDLIESGTPIILYGRLYTKYETSISEVDTYVEAKDGSVYSKGGEVIVPASGETAEDIARAATVDKSGVILGGDLNVVSPNEDINSAFLAISISHGNSQRELAKKAQGKSVVHIHNEEIKNLVVPFPANAEQNKIVEYFSNLDHLITLHQRELENLQNIKKFMLGKMFV